MKCKRILKNNYDVINKRKKMFHLECLKFTKNRYSMYSRERERKKKASTIKALQYSQNYLYEWENVSKQRHLLLYLCERFFSLSMAPALFNIALKKRIVYSTSGKRFFHIPYNSLRFLFTHNVMSMFFIVWIFASFQREQTANVSLIHGRKYFYFYFSFAIKFGL